MCKRPTGPMQTCSSFTMNDPPPCWALSLPPKIRRSIQENREVAKHYVLLNGLHFLYREAKGLTASNGVRNVPVNPCKIRDRPVMMQVAVRQPPDAVVDFPLDFEFDHEMPFHCYFRSGFI